MQKSFVQYGIVIRKYDTGNNTKIRGNKNIQNGTSNDSNGSKENKVMLENGKNGETNGNIHKENNHDNGMKNVDGNKNVNGHENGDGNGDGNGNENEMRISKNPNGTDAWTNMKLKLLAHSTHIARESNDLNSALGTLCLMIRLMGELEMRQQQQLAAWISSITETDEKLRNNSNKSKNNQNNENNQNNQNNNLNNDINNDNEKSENEEDFDEINSANFSMQKLLITIKGRKILTSELIAHRWNISQYGQGNPYVLVSGDTPQTPQLNASNISRLGLSNPPGSYGYVSTIGTYENNSQVRGKSSANSRISGGRRGSGSVNAKYTTTLTELESKLIPRLGSGSGPGSGPGSRMSIRFDKSELIETVSGNRNNGQTGQIGPGPRVPFSLQNDLKKVHRLSSIYDEKIPNNSGSNDGNNDNSNINNDDIKFRGKSSSLNSRVGNSASGSVTSVSSYTMFSPPSILGISTNLEKKRNQNNLLKKKHHSNSAAGRLINAQLQNYQTITNTANDAANFLSSIILPDGQPLPTPPNNLNLKKNNYSGMSRNILKSGLNLSNIPGPKIKLPSASRLTSIVMNGQTNVRTVNVTQKSTMSVSDHTPITNSSQKSILKEKNQIDESVTNTQITMTNENIEINQDYSLFEQSLDSLSFMIFDGGVSPQQQEQGVELLEQLGREVE